MKHLFVNNANQVPTWRQAFPGADYFTREDMVMRTTEEACLIWLRLIMDESSTDFVQYLELLRKNYPASSVVVLSDIPSDSEGVFVLARGVSGYASAWSAPEVLQQIELVVNQGGTWIGAELLQKIVTAASRLKNIDTPVNDSIKNAVSEREWEVAKRVADGESNKEIAIALNLSERTVKAHLSSIFEKTKIRDRLQLALMVNGIE